MTSSALDARAGLSLFFKCENLQKVGAFKARGAANAVLSLPDAEIAGGVATHSSGNHAAALAWAAGQRGVAAHVVMPENAPPVKRAAVQEYGGRIRTCASTLAAREATLAEVVAETGAVYIPPYNDARVICGQGTAALELMEDVPDLDAVIAPVGGGGLLSGTAIAVHGLRPNALVLGAEPAGADDAARSLAAGHIVPMEASDTIADGLRTSLGSLTFPIIQAHVERIVTVSDAEIVAAMRLLWERMKLVVEPSGAVPLAALLSGRAGLEGKRGGGILSGGNVDLDVWDWRCWG
jgi:threonine dehydratase